MNWEYRTEYGYVDFNPFDEESFNEYRGLLHGSLNEMGENGWELVSVAVRADKDKKTV